MKILNSSQPGASVGLLYFRSVNRNGPIRRLVQCLFLLDVGTPVSSRQDWQRASACYTLLRMYVYVYFMYVRIVLVRMHI